VSTIESRVGITIERTVAVSLKSSWGQNLLDSWRRLSARVVEDEFTVEVRFSIVEGAWTQLLTTIEETLLRKSSGKKG
jgi:hypothetical protein